MTIGSYLPPAEVSQLKGLLELVSDEKAAKALLKSIEDKTQVANQAFAQAEKAEAKAETVKAEANMLMDRAKARMAEVEKATLEHDRRKAGANEAEANLQGVSYSVEQAKADLKERETALAESQRTFKQLTGKFRDLLNPVWELRDWLSA